MTKTLVQELELCKSTIATLVAIRKAKGLSQIDIARLMETDQAFISRLEGTPDNEISLKNIKRYADALNLQITFRLKRKGNNEQEDNRAKPTRRRELV